jgi:hypothetical protein
MSAMTQTAIDKAAYLLGSPNNIVGFNTPGASPVPVYRAQAWALWAAHINGARYVLTSAIRTDAVLEDFNRKNGTDLHGQEYLYEGYIRGEAGFLPANPPTRTSHCGFQDGSTYYPDLGARLPNIKWGIDCVDDGSVNDAAKTVWHLNNAGLHAAKAYPGESSENHHIVLLCSPREAWLALFKQSRKAHNARWAEAQLKKRQV